MRPFAWLLAFCACSSAADPVTLYCARGVPDYPDAEVTLKAEGRHVVDVTFVGFRPTPGRAQWSLQDCLNVALKLDPSRAAVGTLWYRERRSPAREQLLRLEKSAP